MRVNFFGDFVADEVDTLCISEELSKIISESSYNVVNFEAPIRIKDCNVIKKSGPSICQSPQSPQWLQNNNFNVITMANNHICDYGSNAILETLRSFSEVNCIGVGKWADAYKPLILNKDGETLGLIALTHCEFGTLYDNWRKDDKLGTAWIGYPGIPNLIKELKKDVDYLVILPHAGIENINLPLPEYRDLYRSFIDFGADMVIASHPHIIQGYEKYKGGYIYYSLGNFYFPWINDEQQPNSWYKGLGVSVLFDKGNIKVEHLFTSFINNSIYLDDSKQGESLLLELNIMLGDDIKYLDCINNYCMELLQSYYRLFYMGGLVKVHSRDFVKRTCNILLKRTNYSLAHLLNNIRCESHRYALLRALEIEFQREITGLYDK